MNYNQAVALYLLPMPPSQHTHENTHACRALGLRTPAYYHCPLVCDPVTNTRLAKRHDALSLRALRERGMLPADVLAARDLGALQPAVTASTYM